MVSPPAAKAGRTPGSDGSGSSGGTGADPEGEAHWSQIALLALSPFVVVAILLLLDLWIRR